MSRASVVGVLLALALAGPAGAAEDARLLGPFTMKGRITRAVSIRGEHRDQSVRRTWTFAPRCTGSVACDSVLLARERAGHHVQQLTLHRRGRGVYRGRGSYYAPLRCAGRLLARGWLVRTVVRVRIVAFTLVQATRFATSLSATYDNPGRVNRTRCAGGAGTDAAVYRGALAGPLPQPPAASFVAAPAAPASLTERFRDTSTPAAGNAPVVRWAWDFGDPASGPADQAGDAAPDHTFSGPGTYTVTLTVTDANGLTAATSAPVSVPAPAR